MTSLLPADGSTIAPLPEPLRNSLIAVTTLALLSFVSTTLLVLYITYRLVKWDVAVQQTKRQVIEDAMIRQTEVDGTNDLSLGLEERHYVYLKAKLPSPPNSEPPTPRFEKDRVLEEVKDKRWNPILMLIYNLLCANLIEAMAFLLSVVWVKRDGIYVPTAACWAQGWFMQVGKLVCSGMLVLISVNTYTTICWVNPEYTVYSLWLEYFWIFVAMAVTSGWVFYGIAGAMIASHGWLNVLLWSTTIIFIGDHDIRETGLEKFAFLRTPQRVYGNMVMVQGGNDTDGNTARRCRHGSQESLRRSRSLDHSVIEVEIEAKVVVEDVKHSYPEQGKETAI
ncbi:hypothetical protein E8E14_001497 [Neopestalotiopsis sp. 37M]|nr:hypothetical protein E8E14_001497 [Neopestalotiopsis sp. 37M]